MSRRHLITAIVIVSTFAAGVLGSLRPVSATRGTLAWNPATWLATAGRDGQMWVSQAPGAYTPYGGGMPGPPAVFTSHGVPYFIVVGSDQALYVTTAANGWARLSPSYTACIFRPAAVLDTSTASATSAGTLWVMCTGTNQGIYYGQTSMPTSGLPSIPDFTAFDGAAASGGGLAVVNGTLTFFVPGTDTYVYARTLTTHWTRVSNWQVLDSVTAASSAGSGSNTYVGLHGTDGHLYVGTSVKGGPWATVNAGGAMLGGPGIAAYGTGTARIFVEGTDHHVYDWLTTNPSGAFEFEGSIVRRGVGASA